MNNTFLQQDDNIDKFCQLINQSTKLKNVDLEGIELNETAAFKILDALSKKTELWELNLKGNQSWFTA